jgi:hypothetical protein
MILPFRSCIGTPLSVSRTSSLAKFIDARLGPVTVHRRTDFTAGSPFKPIFVVIASVVCLLKTIR